MGVYGAILGGYEQAGLDLANEINTLVNERTFEEHPDLVAYLETYASLEIHVMIRFGRWKELLEVELPKNQQLMLYRTASIRYGRALAYAMLGNIDEALNEAKLFDTIRNDPDAPNRILHNNTVADLLELDSTMMHGEILYKSGQYAAGLALLKKAVTMQDNLNYDEPWGKMQPIRHAYGGLLCEQGFIEEAISVFRTDLKFHPKNPWAVIGLLECLTKKLRANATFDGGIDTIPSNTSTCSTSPKANDATTATTSTCCSTKSSSKKKKKAAAASAGGSSTSVNAKKTSSDDTINPIQKEIDELNEILHQQQQSQYADFTIAVPCECCHKK